MTKFRWETLVVTAVCLGVLGCSAADKEVEKPSLSEVFEALELSDSDLLQSHQSSPPEYRPPVPVDPRVEEERKAVRQALVRRLDLKREVMRVGGEGQLDVAAVSKSFRRYRARISRCYEIVLRDDLGLHGRVAVRFTVNTNGRMEDVTVTENTTQSEPLTGCLAQQLSRLRTSNAEGGDAEFTWSMDLASP